MFGSQKEKKKIGLIFLLTLRFIDPKTLCSERLWQRKSLCFSTRKCGAGNKYCVVTSLKEEQEHVPSIEHVQVCKEAENPSAQGDRSP